MSTVLRNTALFALTACLAAPLVPKMMAHDVPKPGPAAQARADGAQASARPTAAAPPSTQVTVDADRTGHYRTEARIDGVGVPVLVDTGATLVALTEADARRLGLFLADADFKYQTATANGVAKVAITTLREVQVGGIRVNDVKASVHRGDGLSVSLLGMSFLGRLSKMEAADRRLVLRQ